METPQTEQPKPTPAEQAMIDLASSHAKVTKDLGLHEVMAGEFADAKTNEESVLTAAGRLETRLRLAVADVPLSTLQEYFVSVHMDHFLSTCQRLSEAQAMMAMFAAAGAGGTPEETPEEK